MPVDACDATTVPRSPNGTTGEPMLAILSPRMGAMCEVGERVQPPALASLPHLKSTAAGSVTTRPQPPAPTSHEHDESETESGAGDGRGSNGRYRTVLLDRSDPPPVTTTLMVPGEHFFCALPVA